MKPFLVAACGNVMAGDDAFGPRVAEAFRVVAPDDVEVIDAGMKPLGLLDVIEGREGLIVVDAALPVDQVSLEELIVLDMLQQAVPPLVHDRALSSHGLAIADELMLAGALGVLPRRVHLVAAQIRSTNIGQPMSPHMTPLVDRACRRLLEIAEQWRASARI
jgi:hydrogenase maturation protease